MDSIIEFFSSLPADVEYAIERGLEDIRQSCKGDLDVLIRKQDFEPLLHAARASGLLVSVSITYGGARIFLGKNSNNLKRVDMDWKVHYRGIPQLPVDHYLAQRQRDPATDLFVLPPARLAEIAYFIKNCYGGAEKYRGLLEKHGFRVLEKRQRIKLIAQHICHSPFQALIGRVRYLLCYLLRFYYPSGLTISGVSCESLRRIKSSGYLFQDRVGPCGMAASLLQARLMSKLCVKSGNRRVAISFDASADAMDIQETIIGYLRKNRTRIPGPLFSLA